jgi:hypothetical protein
VIIFSFVCVSSEFDILPHVPKSFQLISYVRIELKIRILEDSLCHHKQRQQLMKTEKAFESFSVLNGADDGV